MKKLFLVLLTASLASCVKTSEEKSVIPTPHDYVINQVVSVNDSWNEPEKPFMLTTSFDEEEEGRFIHYHTFEVDLGNEKYIDSIRPIRYQECQKLINTLIKLNEPINK